MVEQIMFFALGALCAGLVSIVVLPAFWRRAERLVRMELERQLPLSPAEIAAERDQLRAEFSIRQRNLEISAEQAKLERAQDQRQVGQHLLTISVLKDQAIDLNNNIKQLNATLNERNLTITKLEADKSSLEALLEENQKALVHQIEGHLHLEQTYQKADDLSNQRAAEITALKTATTRLEAQFENSKLAHSQIQKRLDHKAKDYTDLHSAYQRMTALADERRIEISNLTNALDLAGRQIDTETVKSNEMRQVLQTKTHEITKLQRDLEDSQHKSMVLQKRLDATLDLAARRQETIESKNTTLQFKNSALSDAGQQMALLRAELSSEIQARKRVERAVELAEKRIKPLEDNLQTVTRQSQETARDLTQTIETLQASSLKIKRSRPSFDENLAK